MLDEVSNLANRLRTQALEGREETLELAKRVNDFQARIKSTTRRMMATVSELSMYQVRTVADAWISLVGCRRLTDSGACSM